MCSSDTSDAGAEARRPEADNSRWVQLQADLYSTEEAVTHLLASACSLCQTHVTHVVRNGCNELFGDKPKLYPSYALTSAMLWLALLQLSGGVHDAAHVHVPDSRHASLQSMHGRAGSSRPSTVIMLVTSVQMMELTTSLAAHFTMAAHRLVSMKALQSMTSS